MTIRPAGKIEVEFSWVDGPNLDITITFGDRYWLIGFFWGAYDTNPPLPVDNSEPDLQGNSLDDLHREDLRPTDTHGRPTSEKIPNSGPWFGDPRFFPPRKGDLPE